MAYTFDEALGLVLAREVSGFSSLLACEQLTAGASQETYRVSVGAAGGERTLALRRAVPTMEVDSSLGALGLEGEARLLQLAKSAGIPEPEVVYVLRDSDGLGAGFLMEWLEGETLGQRIVRSPELAGIRPQLAFQCGEVLARIHALDWKSADMQPLLSEVSPAALVDEAWASYRDLQVPVPMLDYTWRWLRDNLPRDSRQTLVHGDFRNGNLMITPAGISAVLDWELAHVGDPVRDLGWLCVNSWRFGQHDLPVGGFGLVEDLLAGYRSVAGIDVSLEHLRFWQVFGSFYWSTLTLQMVQAWRTGEAPSLERPVIGRRSSEGQMDCVNLLIPGDFDLPDPDIPISDGARLPMPAELLEGVVGFLRNDIAPGAEPRTRFLARVAANSLGIAQRELQHGEALAQREHERLEVLLDTNGELDTLRRELVNRLRDGLPLDTPGLPAHLRQTVAGQLAVDQPGYSAIGAFPSRREILPGDQNGG